MQQLCLYCNEPQSYTTNGAGASPLPSTPPGSEPDVILDQSSDGVDSGAECGMINAAPCTAARVRPCQCGLYLEESTGTCAAEISAGPCPVRPYCGYDGGPPCSFPGDRPCDECLEVEAVTATCIRNPNCVRGRLKKVTLSNFILDIDLVCSIY